MRLIGVVFFLVSICCFGQDKVGVVLSGGGAKGMVHVGVLKALEEYGIPIDYITGTSAGALVGGLYASGYSPQQIEEIMLSDAFQKMATGQIERRHRYTYREQDDDPSMLRFGLRANQSLLHSIPTHLRSSAYVDYVMLRFYGVVSEMVHNDFDSLFVPFRCVGADITHKRAVAFRSGKLNQAVRASMTYPFYFEPIEIDGVLYFDGGLYDNFPVDVLYEQFNPDFVIGSKVANNFKPPKKNDLISQITNMMVRETNFVLPCENSLLIEPKISSSTFDFQDVALLIQQGYDETVRLIDSILPYVSRRVSVEELQEKRKAFRSRVTPFVVSKVSTHLIDGESLPFARKTMLNNKKPERINSATFEKRYFRLQATPQIAFLFPTIDLQPDSAYQLNLTVNKAKEFDFKVGGFFASRPINTAYVGVGYNYIGSIASRFSVNVHLGKFYSAMKSQIDIDIPSVRLPLYFTMYYVRSTTDFFRSFENFFVDEKPSYIIEKENFVGLDFKRPIGNAAKVILQGRYFQLKNNYFQDYKIFQPKDTADYTNFQGATLSLELQQNSLNRKQFASQGHFISLKARYIYGIEHSLSGNLAPTFFDTTNVLDWISLSAEIKSFFVNSKHFQMGWHGTAVYNSAFNFSNLTATELVLTPYTPLPDMHTHYISVYRTPIYAGGGLNFVFRLSRNVDFRFEPYFYQIFRPIGITSASAVLIDLWAVSRMIVSSSVVWHIPLGPLRFTVSHYPGASQFAPDPLFFQFTFGYVLFNQRALR